MALTFIGRETIPAPVLHLSIRDGYVEVYSTRPEARILINSDIEKAGLMLCGVLDAFAPSTPLNVDDLIDAAARDDEDEVTALDFPSSDYISRDAASDLLMAIARRGRIFPSAPRVFATRRTGDINVMTLTPDGHALTLFGVQQMRKNDAVHRP